MPAQKEILWLTSWYPDEMNPFNGDFIQRHAVAVARHMPITVIYVAQHGPKKTISSSRMTSSTHGNLTEIIVFFKFRPTGLAFLDRVRFHIKYYQCFRKNITRYIKRNGRPRLVHVHVPMKAGRIAIWLKEKFGIPFIISEQSSAYTPDIPDGYPNRNLYYRKWVKKIYEEAEAATTVSNKIGNLLQQLFKIRRMEVIPNVANVNYFHYAGEAPTGFVFVHASTMDHAKNVEGLLEALAKLKKQRGDWKCIMLGWDKASLKTKSAELGLQDHVEWKGVVPYPEVAKYMQGSSAFIMFSRYENMPCVVLESLCCGVPVIATKVGGIPEVVNDSNGILVESGDTTAMAAAMKRFMENPERYNRRVIATDAQALYSYDALGKRFVELYESLYRR